ncbi:MAG: sensor histidine kinase [Alphaproteobacteria bacterium]
MKALFRSLAFRLGVGIAAIVIAAFFALVYAYQQSIKFEFHQLVEVDTLVEGPGIGLMEDLAQILTTAFAEGGWPRVEENFPGGPLLLIDAEGQVISGKFEVGSTVDFLISGEQFYEIKMNLSEREENQLWLAGVPGVALLTGDGEVFGHLLFMDGPGLPDRSAGFASSVSETAALYIIPIALLTIILVGLSVRYGLSPVHQVTNAARTLRGGKIPEPVKAKASGEVGDLVSAFNSAVEELARTEDMRQKFITAVAHELRTPVTNLKGQLEALEAGLIKKDKEFLKIMQVETGLLESLIGDLQDLAISDAGRLKVYPEALNLGREVDEAWKGFYGAKSAKFENSIPESLEVFTDPRRLRQILQNLYSNALNARHKGLVVKAEAKMAGKMVEISLEDNGPGIAAEDLPHIFERFYRADQSRTRDTGGAGLGLSIVKTFVEAHGGKVTAESPPKNGTRIIFTLPIAK